MVQMIEFNFTEYLSARWGKGRELSEFSHLLELLGDPQLTFRCIHVAGTNGKGSTCSYTQSILQEQGFKTGLYTSPALKYVNERIMVCGVPVDNETIEQAAYRVYQAEMQSGFHYGGFDRMTATALVVFAQAGVEFAVLETGLGGRLDATNACKSEIAIITSIGLDHMHILGNTIEEIAMEKCGIIKSEQKYVVSHRQDPRVEAIIAKTCEKMGVKLLQTKDYKIVLNYIDQYRQYFDIIAPNGAAFSFDSGLLGRHQLENACAAWLTCRALKLDPICIKEGISNAQWRGRLELLQGSPDVLLDGAHNPQATEVLVSSLDEYFIGRKFVLITTVMRDKDYPTIVSMTSPKVSNVITVSIGERSVDPNELAKLYQMHDVPAKTSNSIEQAYHDALSICKEMGEDAMILVTGSLYLVGEFRDYLMSLEQE